MEFPALKDIPPPLPQFDDVAVGAMCVVNKNTAEPYALIRHQEKPTEIKWHPMYIVTSEGISLFPSPDGFTPFIFTGEEIAIQFLNEYKKQLAELFVKENPLMEVFEISISYVPFANPNMEQNSTLH